MTVQLISESGEALERVRLENETLYAVIKTVSSSLDLDRVPVADGQQGNVPRFPLGVEQPDHLVTATSIRS